MRIGLATAVLLAACGTSGAAGDGGPAADAGPAGDAFDLADARDVSLALQFIDPDHGPYTGGTEIAVRGIGFADGIDVRIGGRSVDPAALQVIDSRRITVVAPPGDPGPADVEVVLPTGESATLPDAFDYEAITVAPPSGSVAGGTFVTISGLGTDWDDTTVVTFDGIPLDSTTLINEGSITGFTPPGIAGTADIKVTTGSVEQEARRAFTYLATADPFFGGMGGGPINGTVNVVVLDANTDDGVPNAFVALGDPTTTSFKGRTDALGQITFSDPSLTGPVTLTAAADGYETQMMVEFDATDVTVFMRQPPPPFTGPIPPAPALGTILGHVLFGDSVSIGSPTWDLVPEPRTPTERKRVYVTTTARTMFSTSFVPNGFIDYEFDPQVTAWEFEVTARPSAVAVVAIAGLYDPNKDPSGDGVTGFEPFAMGVTRGILVGPGEVRIGVDVVVNIPLDSAVRVALDHPPVLNSPDWTGPTEYTIRPFLDLGGEGVIHMNKNGLRTPPFPEPRPNIYTFPDGEDAILLPGMAPLTGDVSDGSYGFIAGAYSANGASPFSVRVARGYDAITLPLTVGDFLPMPRPSDPLPNSLASERHLVLEDEGEATGQATFNLHYLRSSSGQQLFRILARGDVMDVDLPDLSGEGFPPLPVNEDVEWTFWRISVPGTSFDQFNYRMLSALYWDAYAADSYYVQLP